MKKPTIILLSALCLCTIMSCNQQQDTATPAANVHCGTFTDTRDGREYRTATIGGTLWMAENLNYKTGGSYCYNNADSTCEKYGRLYTWYAAMTTCPFGWVLPDNEDWKRLVNTAGGKGVAGSALKSKTGWGSYDGQSGNGDDHYGFSALPNRWFYDGYDKPDSGSGGWWSSSESEDEKAYFIYTFNYSAAVHTTPGDKDNPSQVRCVWVGHGKGAAEKEYRAVTIGNHTWMAENLNIETRGSWCYDGVDENCTKYGRLYSWYAAMRACPPGWHLPNKAEWEDLMVAVGGVKSKMQMQKRGDVDIYRGVGKKLKSKSGWGGTFGNGTDDYGFSALPGGTFYDYRKSFGYYGADSTGSFWSAIETDAAKLDTTAGNHHHWPKFLHRYRDAFFWQLSYYDDTAIELDGYATYGHSVRCVRDF